MNELKEDIKSRARKIRAIRQEVKADLRAGKPANQNELEAKKLEYRYRHVAYSLIRGKTREQIEKKVRPGNELDEELLKMYIEAFEHHRAIKTGTLSKAPPDPDKLYIVVCDLLPKTYAGVQASHALAEYLRQNPKSPWTNGTLVVLKADMSRLHYYERIGWTAFREIDLGNRLTAVATFKPKVLPKDLSLL
jgi:hypothetical protein